MAKFIISVDSCVDRFASFLKQNDISCIKLRRITDGVESAELYDSIDEYEQFYKAIKKGALPTTSQLNPCELTEHFESILNLDFAGDIIHISLSSGLSNTFNSCVIAANELNQKLTNRKIYAFDSLSASLGIAMLLDRLIELRDSGESAENAIRILSEMRDNQQVWAAIGNLFHLKRGGRISGVQAAIGTFLNVRPILIINDKGKLVIEGKLKGIKKSIAYLIDKFDKLGKFDSAKNKRVYIMHSSAKEELELLKQGLKQKFSGIEIVEGMIGPIIGTHVGEGTVALIFEGDKRLKI